EVHFRRAPRTGLSAVRSRFTARALPSKRKRHDGERAVLAARGDRIVTYQIQGDLTFAATEVVIRRLVAEPAAMTHLVLDFARAGAVAGPAARMLLELLAGFAE